MISIILLLLAFVCIEAAAITYAPEGYQDSTGFHYGKPLTDDQTDVE